MPFVGEKISLHLSKILAWNFILWNGTPGLYRCVIVDRVQVNHTHTFLLLPSHFQCQCLVCQGAGNPTVGGCNRHPYTARGQGAPPWEAITDRPYTARGRKPHRLVQTDQTLPGAGSTTVGYDRQTKHCQGQRAPPFGATTDRPCIRSEIHAISYALTVNGCHLWFHTYAECWTVSPLWSLRVAWPRKHKYRSWISIPILYTRRYMDTSGLEAAILKFQPPAKSCSVLSCPIG